MSDQIRDSLDDAIDRAAASLVTVQEDPNAAQRIVSSLPSRHERRWWSMSSLPLQAAAAASIILGVLYMRPATDEDVRSADALGQTEMLDARPVVNVAEFLPTAVSPPSLARNRSASFGEAGSRPLSRGPADSEATSRQFELSAIPAPELLTMTTLEGAAPLDPVEPTSVAPILLSSLPLAGDAQPPFSKE
ncbi:MAG: hypothetical protein ACRD2N_10425 [Vicinamibacterales bacterium]